MDERDEGGTLDQLDQLDQMDELDKLEELGEPDELDELELGCGMKKKKKSTLSGSNLIGRYPTWSDSKLIYHRFTSY